MQWHQKKSNVWASSPRAWCLCLVLVSSEWFVGYMGLYHVGCDFSFFWSMARHGVKIEIGRVKQKRKKLFPFSVGLFFHRHGPVFFLSFCVSFYMGPVFVWPAIFFFVFYFSFFFFLFLFLFSNTFLLFFTRVLHFLYTHGTFFWHLLNIFQIQVLNIFSIHVKKIWIHMKHFFNDTKPF